MRIPITYWASLRKDEMSDRNEYFHMYLIASEMERKTNFKLEGKTLYYRCILNKENN